MRASSDRQLLTWALVVAVLIATMSPTAAAPSRPRDLTARTIGDDQAVVTWQRPPGARRFAVQVSTSRSFAAGTTRTLSTRRDEHFLVIRSLAPGTRYVVRVRTTGSRPSAWTTVRSFTTTAPSDDFGVMTYNLLCADYCVEGKRHTSQTFPWLKRRARVVNDLRASSNVDVVGLQEAGGYVATGWNCRTRRPCGTPAKLAPDGEDQAYDRFCTRRQCPTRVKGGRYGGTPRQIDDIMRRLPEFGITPIAGDPNRRENGSSYLRIMWRTSTFELTRAGSIIDIDGRRYEKKVRWHRKAYWAILTQRSTGQSYFVVTAHPVADSGVSRAEGYPKGASPSAVRGAGARRLVSEIRRLNTGGLPVVLAGDLNTTSSRDGSLTVLKAAGYTDTRSAAGPSRRINARVASGNGFDPRRIAPRDRRAPVDHVLTLPGRGASTIDTRLWWLQAPVRGSHLDNCRRTHRAAAPAAGCWGSDHFPVIAQLRPRP
ncbi:MAG: fibronectin type III domain-containing protein [Aeromicrobium sp.]